MKNVFCFGELLLRISPVLNGEWIRNTNMDVYIGGAELNVASALAKWNIPVQYCSALPDNYLSIEICDELSKKNIDVSQIIFSGNRIGVYFLPQGKDLKHAGVIYDRAYSSFSELKPGMINWDEVLTDAGWFHFSAISPALNKDIAMICKEAILVAVQKQLTISVDLNYRSRLWQYGKHPGEVMASLVENCDVVMGNIWSANSLLGIKLDEHVHDKKSKAAYLAHASQTAKDIMQQFPKCKMVANTFRFDEGGGIKYYATSDQDSHQYVSPEFYSAAIVDKVGSGDCFMAGLIYGLYHQFHAQEIINFAAAAAFAKLHEVGDATSKDVTAIKSKYFSI